MTDLDAVLGDFYPPDAVPAVPRKLSEADFMRQVTELAELLGYETLHLRGAWSSKGYRVPVQGSLGKGWPDLVLLRVRDRRLIFAELKADIGKVSAEQEAVLDMLGVLTDLAPEIEVRVWRPADFDRITEILR